MSELGDKIRALKRKTPKTYSDIQWDFALDRAATLADEHQAAQLSNDERLEYQQALIWCSAAADFATEGQAREGWLKLCKPLIDRQPTYQPQAEAGALVAAAYDDAPERIWATEDRENFGEDRFHATTPMRGLTEYLRADIAAAREADLRADMSKRNNVIAKVYGRVAAVVQSISDEGDRVYFGSSNDADILRDLAREWDDARILKEDIRTSEEEVRDLRAEVERCHARLEIDHAFTAGPNDQLVRHEIPMAERASMPDGIECRDDTIRLQDEQIARLRALLDEARAGFVEIIHHTDNTGIEYASVGMRVAERVEDTARATLAKIGGQHD